MIFLGHFSESLIFNIADLPSLLFLLLFCPLLYLLLNQKNMLINLSAAFLFHIVVLFLILLGSWKTLNFPSVNLTANLPFSDGKAYLEGAINWLNGHPLVSASARRPEYSLFLAGILRVTQLNFSLAQIILTFLVSLNLAIFSIALRDKTSSLVAALFSCFLILYYRQFANFNGTEQLGITLGLLAATFLLEFNLFFGFFFLTLGLVSRSGPFFIIPLLLVWLLTNKIPRIKTLVPIFASLIAIVIHFSLVQLTTDQRAAPSGNFWYVAHGVASGNEGWAYIFDKFPHLKQEKDERILMHKAKEDTLNSIATKPLLLIKGIGSIYRDFFMNVFLFAKWSEPKTSPLTEPIKNGAWLTVLLLIALYGLLKVPKKSNLGSMLLYGGLGIFISVPFLPPRDSVHMRTYCVTYPFIILMLSLGFDYLLKKFGISLFRPKYISFSQLKLTALISSFFILSIFVFGLASKGKFELILNSKEMPATALCANSEKMIQLVEISNLTSEIVEGEKQSSFQITVEGLKNHLSYLSLVHGLPFARWDRLKSGDKIGLLWEPDNYRLRWAHLSRKVPHDSDRYCPVALENPESQLLEESK